MKKSLLILPIAVLALVGCRGGRGGSSVAPTTQPTISSSAERPASPWGAVPEGNGTESSPWNVTQAWDYVDKNLEETYATASADQDKVKSTEKYYVRGWICYIETVSDGRDPAHPNSIKFHMADDKHYVTEEEVMNKDEAVRNGFCVYFADTEPAIASKEEAEAMAGKCVTVYGYLLNWGFEPEVTIGGVISDVRETA